jgi:hypothetical protein
MIDSSTCSSTPDQLYRLIFGAALLAALYFNLDWLVLGLIAMSLAEGISNLRLSIVVARLTGQTRRPFTSGLLTLDAERLWRLLVGVVLLTSYYFLGDALWFFPWFMGFAILGAGASGVCPMLIGIKSLGFK